MKSLLTIGASALLFTALITTNISANSAPKDTATPPAAERTQAKIEYPRLTPKNTVSNEERTVIDRINANLIEQVGSMLTDHKGMNLAQYQISYEVKSDRPDYLSIVFTHYMYPQGAAHGMLTKEGIVYDKKTGLTVPLTHFMPDLTIAELNKLVADKQAFLRLANGEPLAEKVLWKPNQLPIPTSYYLTKDGDINLIYQPYEIAAFAFGTPELHIPNQTIQRLLKKSK